MRLDFLGHRTLFWLPTLFWKPKKWNSPICTNLKITLIKSNFIGSVDVSETIPNLNSAVNESGGTNKVAYSSIRCVFVDAALAEIVVYKKWPRSMRLDFLGHRTLFWLPTLFWKPKKWNSPICTYLKITLIKRNFIRSLDVSETIPNLNSAVNESGGTNKVAYSSIRCVWRSGCCWNCRLQKVTALDEAWLIRSSNIVSITNIVLNKR